MNYSKDIFKLLDIKPNEIFMTNECDEFIYKLDEDLQGYYFNLEEGDIGFAHINDEWRTEPILIANLLTDKTKIVPMTSRELAIIEELKAKPKIEKKESQNLGDSLMGALSEIKKEYPSVDLEKNNPLTDKGAYNILAAN